MTSYTVPRSQGTYADALLALGLARLLKSVTVQGKVVIRSAQDTDAYLISAQQAPTPEALEYAELYQYIKTAKDFSAPAECFDYEREKERRQQFFKWRDNNRKTPLEQVPEEIGEPRSDYSLHSSLVDMLKPINTSGYAAAHRELASSRFSVHVQVALDAFSSNGQPAVRAEEALKKLFKGDRAANTDVSIVQIFNPMTGKGMNAPKANSIGMANNKAPLVLEALKYAGWFMGAVAVYPQDSKDLKVLVVQPAEIELEQLRQVMTEFRREFTGGGAVQVDILAALTLTETLLRHDEHKTFRRGRPRDIVQGFQTAYFQNLGSAKGVTNISFIALPDWVRLTGDPAQAEQQRQTWLSVLKEHRQIIRNLDESHSDERTLLEQYRDFLSGQDVTAFLEFLSGYGTHALHLADRGKFVLWMTTDHLGRVLRHMERNDITAIISNSGFQSVAGAIRRATRSALYAKKLQNDRTYEIHYGLAQELKRSAVTKAKFMTALSNFVAEYMTENLRAADRDKRGRAAVTTEDLLSVGTLLDTHDPQMVAMLLIAYGYAKEPRDDAPDATSIDQTETPTPDTTPDQEDFQ
jgi:hypothetical protein